MKRALPLLLLALLLAASAQAQLSPRRIIDAAKEARASDLDPELPRVPLGAWIRAFFHNRAAIQWEANDCGEQAGDRDADAGRDFPACAEITATLRDGREVVIVVVVGNYEKGLAPKPELWDVLIIDGEKNEDIARLSELPEKLGLPAPQVAPARGKKKRP